MKLLKTEGPFDSKSLGARLGVSAMAIRQHLYALQDQRLVVARERPIPFGDQRNSGNSHVRPTVSFPTHTLN